MLHYVENNKLLNDNTLVLIDAGCEVEGYAADITRTFPVTGRFSPAQKDVYAIVPAAQETAIAAIRPGQSFMAPHDAALHVLTQGLVDLKLLTGAIDGLIESEAYKPVSYTHLNYRDGKERYIADLPRFLAYARRVAGRYIALKPFLGLLDQLEGVQREEWLSF